jgi:hypothetical protein
MVAAFIGLLLPSAAAAPGAAQTEQARVDGSIVWGSLDSVILEYGVDRSGGYIQEKLIKKGLAGAVAGKQQEAVLVFTNTATSEAQELKVAMGGREDTAFETRLTPGRYRLRVRGPASVTADAAFTVEVPEGGDAVYVGDLFFAGPKDRYQLWSEENLDAREERFRQAHSDLPGRPIRIQLCSTPLWRADVRKIGPYLAALSAPRAQIREVLFLHVQNQQPVNAFLLSDFSSKSRVCVVTKKAERDTIGRGQCVSAIPVDGTKDWKQSDQVVAQLQLPYCDGRGRPRCIVKFSASAALKALPEVPTWARSLDLQPELRDPAKPTIADAVLGPDGGWCKVKSAPNATTVHLVLEDGKGEKVVGCFLQEYDPQTNTYVAVVPVRDVVTAAPSTEPQ